jgi:hypothetical protein
VELFSTIRAHVLISLTFGDSNIPLSFFLPFYSLKPGSTRTLSLDTQLTSVTFSPFYGGADRAVSLEVLTLLLLLLLLLLFTAIVFAPGGSSPTLVLTKIIKQHYTVVQHNKINVKNTIQ